LSLLSQPPPPIIRSMLPPSLDIHKVLIP